jgi:quinol monooxygenase YgiN
MQMIIISAILEFANEVDRDKVIDLTTETQLATRLEEPGCISYCFAPDPAVSNRIQVYELWEDEKSLADHFKHKYYNDMKNFIHSVGVTNTENQMYLIDKHEPVYSAEGNTRETFFN